MKGCLQCYHLKLTCHSSQEWNAEFALRPHAPTPRVGMLERLAEQNLVVILHEVHGHRLAKLCVIDGIFTFNIWYCTLPFVYDFFCTFIRPYSMFPFIFCLHARVLDPHVQCITFRTWCAFLVQNHARNLDPIPIYVLSELLVYDACLTMFPFIFFVCMPPF